MLDALEITHVRTYAREPDMLRKVGYGMAKNAGPNSRGAGYRTGRAARAPVDAWYTPGPQRPAPPEAPRGVKVESWGVLPKKPPRKARGEA
jgi:hypothetical protein